MSILQIFCRTVEFFEPQERRLSLSATQSGGGGSTAGGQGKKDASTKEGPDSSGKDKNEDENKKGKRQTANVVQTSLSPTWGTVTEP